jgi:hypothetical protein
MRTLFRNLFGQRGASTRPTIRRPKARLGLEHLEERTLLSVTFLNPTTLLVAGDDTAAPGGQIPGVNTSFHDIFEVREANGTFEVRLNGQSQFLTTNVTNVTTVILDGRGLTDVVNILGTLEGIAVQVQGIAVGAATPFTSTQGAERVNVNDLRDTLQGIRSRVDVFGTSELFLTAVGDASNRTVTVTGTNVRGLTGNTGSIFYEQGELANLVLRTGGGADTITVNDTPGVTRLETGGGIDTIAVERTRAALTTDAGAADNDVITVVPTGQTLGNLGGTLTIEDGFFRDTVKVHDQRTGTSVLIRDTITANQVSQFRVFNMVAPNQQVVPVARQTTINHNGIGQLELSASSFSNTTVNVVSTGSTRTVVNVGLGNTINVGDAANTLDGIDAAVTINAPAGFAPVVNLRDQGTAIGKNYFLSNGQVQRSSAAPINFTGLGRLSIQAGTGQDSFFVNAQPANTALVLDGGAGTDTLQAPAQANVFEVNGRNAGTLNDRADFTGVERLTGNTSSDRYVFANNQTFQGSISDLGGTNDTLDYSAHALDVVANLDTGVVVARALVPIGPNLVPIPLPTNIQGLEHVLGGSGNDTLTGDSEANILVGNDGTDLLTGGGGPDLLIGGDDIDTLNAGSAGTILIGGMTRNDNNLASLQAILRIWTGTEDYSRRADALLAAGTGLLRSDRVSADGDQDILAGGTGTDLFFRDAQDLFGGVLPDDPERVIQV